MRGVMIAIARDVVKQWEDTMIKKKGSKFQVTSSAGKPLSKPTTKKKAVKRLRQVEYFKHHPKK